jgi:hypothetical protein
MTDLYTSPSINTVGGLGAASVFPVTKNPGDTLYKATGADITAAYGGGGASRIQASARIDCSVPTAPVIANGKNVASVTRTATGLYTVTFTTPIDLSKAGFSGGGEFSPFASTEIVVLGINRAVGAGLQTTEIHLMNYYIQAAAIAVFDNNNWFSFDVTDVTAG